MKDIVQPVILGFDTSSEHCGAVILRGSEELASAHEEMTKGQAERLFPMIDEVLAKAGVSFGDLDAIGVGTGPGNFTGIRISISAARGLALSLGVPAVGVSLFDALAYGMEKYDGPLLLSVKAAQERVYLQTRTGDSISEILIATLDALPPAKKGTVCIGAYAPRIAETLGIDEAQPSVLPTTAIALIASKRWQTVTEPPAPLYVRPADAVPPSDPPPVILPDDA